MTALSAPEVLEHLYPADDDRPRRAAEALEIEIRDLRLLRQALTHRSFLNDRGVGGSQAARSSNERLEFLGDAVLGLYTAEFLFERYPELPEGVLTNYRAALVRKETLAQWARDLGLDALLYLGRGERGDDGEVRDRILADAFEATIAAIYLDRGARVTRRFIQDFLNRDAEAIVTAGEVTNYKSRLQELTQERARVTPVYYTREVAGPEHERDYTVEVVVGDRILGVGTGSSKRLAQQEAARQALSQLAAEGMIEDDERPV